ncbi:pyridoxamine 5'-phosphate oxidase [Streptomyces sp. NPDC007000]|uniref:pyridoxamine 5'-phosphate oxidase n=1 Tax=Streptomyces sp. NPDC007000 TaxID=3155357 RepID=UPI0033DF9273
MRSTEQPRRSLEQRRSDVLDRLERETDISVASVGPEGPPCLVPLWFVWDGEAVWPATRPAFGDTRDVVLIDGVVQTCAAREVLPAAEAFREKTGRDPRADRAVHAFFRVRPRAVQAWCGEHELPERHLTHNGVRPAQGVSRRRRDTPLLVPRRGYGYVYVLRASTAAAGSPRS